jgi:beta-lactamase regulating signal transducer with metallopeptidase domain/HEAT repeat protein
MRKQTRPIHLASVLAWAWIAGSIAWLALVGVRITRFARLLRRSDAADESLAAEVAAVTERIGLRAPPDVRIVDAAVSPMLWFLGRRVQLVLPQALVTSMSRCRREAVVAHELAHLRRGDHWVRLFEIAATALLWWHPLLWLARRGLHEAEEQCCDAWVVALRPDSDARRGYADALVDALELVSRGAVAVPPAATGLGRTKHLHRRVTMILTETPRASLSPVGKCFIAAVVLAGVALAPVRGQAPPAGGAGGSTLQLSATTPATSPSSLNSAADDPETRRAVTALLEAAARDANQAVKNASSQAIGQFGTRAVPALLDAMRDPTLVETARLQLAQLGPDSFDPLLDALESSDAAVRREALTAIAQIFATHLGIPGPGVPGGFGGAAPAGRVGGGFVGGFGAGGEGGIPVAVDAAMPQVMTRLITAVTKATRDSDVGVRRAAIRVLQGVAPQAAMANKLDAVMPSVIAAMKDADAEVRGGAAWALTSVANQSAGFGGLDALIAAVKDEDETVRYAALNALKMIGPPAKAATPTVIAALKDRQPTVRAAAAEALGSLQSTPTPQPPGFGSPTDPSAAPQ